MTATLYHPMPILDRMFLSKYSSDMIAALSALLFAAWSFIGQDFHTAPSLMAIAQRWPGSEEILGACGLMSCAFLTLGIIKANRGFRVAGWVTGFSLFLSCFASTVYTLPRDPAAPAFLALALWHLWMASLVTTRIR